MWVSLQVVEMEIYRMWVGLQAVKMGICEMGMSLQVVEKETYGIEMVHQVAKM